MPAVGVGGYRARKYYRNTDPKLKRDNDSRAA